MFEFDDMSGFEALPEQILASLIEVNHSLRRRAVELLLNIAALREASNEIVPGDHRKD